MDNFEKKWFAIFTITALALSFWVCYIGYESGYEDCKKECNKIENTK